jgi:hypothetical protein
VTEERDVDSVLAAYRAVHRPDADASARMWSSLAKRAVAGDMVALDAEPEVVVARSRVWMFGAAAAAAVAAIGLSIGAVSVAEQQGASFEQTVDQAEPTATPQSVHEAEVVAPKRVDAPAVLPTTAPAIEAPATPEPPRVRPPRTKPIVTQPPEPSIDAAEILDLRRAQRLLARAPAEALRLLDAHADAYPRSTLAAERSVARITALCNAGRSDASREAAEDFAAKHPGSPLVARVQGTCADVSNAETESP